MLGLHFKAAGWLLLILGLNGVTAQKNTCLAGIASDGAECIHRQHTRYASPYCSSVLRITTPTTTKTITTLDTVFQNSTTTRTITTSGRPPITTTVLGTTTINSTTTVTKTSTTITATFPTFVATTTVTSTSFTNQYVCSRGASSIPASTSVPPMSSASVPVNSSSIRSSSSSAVFSFSFSSDLFSSVAGSSSSLLPSFSSIPIISFSRGESSSNIPISTTIPSFSIMPTGTGFSRPSGSASNSASRGPWRNSTSISHSASFSVSTPVSASFSASTSVSASITASESLPHYYPPNEKRAHITIFPSPRCLRKFQRANGDAALSQACECLEIATPAPKTRTVTTADPATTVTSIRTIEVTSTTTITPTQTSTQYSTTTKSFSATTTITEMAVTTESLTYSITTVATSTITQSYPTPTSFNIYYTNSTSNNTNAPANFFQAIEAPGGSGIVLAPEAAADNFMLDSQGRLVDTTGGDAFIAKNTDDLYPFELLQTTAATSNTPICSACQGVLQCDYPGTKGNTFALCYGYLALGPPDVFGKDSTGDGHIDCVPITLRFK